MERTKDKFIGLLILGAILLLLPALGEAQVFVNCTSTVTLASKLASAAASPTRTLFVSGVCVENVTVRNLRVIIDGQGVAILKPLDLTKATITFRGGTTEATIQNFTGTGHIDTGTNPADSSNGGTACNVDGNTLKGGDGIDVRDGANVTIGQAAAFDVPAHTAGNGNIIKATLDVPALGNTINVLGAGRGVRVRNGANASLNANTINGNKLRPDFTSAGTGVCAGVLAKSFKGSTGIDVSSAAIAALGTLVNQTADAVVGGATIDNRNTVSGHDIGLNCAEASLTGIKAPTSNPAGANGVNDNADGKGIFVASVPTNTTPLKGYTPYVDPSTQVIYNKLCFTDE